MRVYAIIDVDVSRMGDTAATCHTETWTPIVSITRKNRKYILYIVAIYSVSTIRTHFMQLLLSIVIGLVSATLSAPEDRPSDFVGECLRRRYYLQSALTYRFCRYGEK